MTTLPLSTGMMSRRPKILSDEPKLSSAALCTTLKHLHQTFRPEFTHQCVEEESFRGYQPLTSVLAKAQSELLPSSSSTSDSDAVVLHKSHLRHEQQVTSELEITIDLAPSCRTCRLLVTTKPKKRKANDDDETMTMIGDDKRQKMGDNSSKVPCIHNTTKETEQAEVEPMSLAEIQNAISKALPDITVDNDDMDCIDDYLSKPMGTLLREYTINDKTFCLSLANGSDPATCDYHQKVQKLALWFIENADDVDVSNEQSGHWKVLYLFLHCPKQKYAVVGYCTLFHFNSPFHKPVPGTIVRICQALVLPPFQGQGHGKKMMQCLYDAVHNRIEGAYGNSQDQQEVVEINVEDPAPGFVALRNKVDWKLLKDHPEYWSNAKVDNNIAEEAFFASIPEAQAIQVGANAKITPHQVHIVHEMQRLEALHNATFDTSTNGGGGVNEEELERRYRLLVKRRLNKDHREDLSSFGTKDAKKAYLAKLFDEQLALYNRLLPKGSKKR
ncbi:unnamed protein product [Cylindrotheca closterium]|uniref:Histone acetyl transferase HAT1 N-terminal domain-containing protein n=1 Tax=Cylindrotheca closterium TaxID=2856 RepID=A0AAD2CLV2_9STRA|nr:unnamed protein product [Cylindrotheca closterium]